MLKKKMLMFGLVLALILFSLEIVAIIVGNESDVFLKRGIRELFPYIFIFVQISALTNYYCTFKGKIEMIYELIDPEYLKSKYENESDFATKMESKIFNRTYLITGFLFGMVYFLSSYNRYLSWHNNPQSSEVIQHLYYTSLPSICHSLILWFIIYFILGITFQIILTSITEFSKIGRSIPVDKSAIKPYSTDRCGNLSKLSDLFVSLAICCYTLLILGMTIFLKLQFRWFDTILITIAFVIISLSFFGSQFGLHASLQKVRNEELTKLSNQLEQSMRNPTENNGVQQADIHYIRNIYIMNKINNIEKMNLWIFTTKSVYDFGINFMASVSVFIIGFFS